MKIWEINTCTSNFKRLYGSELGYKKLAEAGFVGVDYGEPCSAYKPFGGIYAASDAEFDEYFAKERVCLDAAGLRVNQTHAPFPTYPDPPVDANNIDAEFEFMIEALKKSLRATRIVGGKFMVMHCAMRCGWRADDDFDLTREMNKRVYSAVIPEAKKQGVVIALENMPCHGIPTAHPEQLIDYIDMMGEPEYFRACLDTGHANITKEKVGDYVRTLGSRLAALHIHDNDSTRDWHTCPYTGTVDWEDFIKALREVGYEGTLSLEADAFGRKLPPELYPRSETYMKELLDSLQRLY